jgi:anti-sigma regulatory factor (Ser/Thr protein kinase)
MPSRDRQRALGNRSGGSPQAHAPAVLDQRFDRTGLFALRSAVAACAADLGTPERLVDDLVVIANELASNAVRHGGGAGRLLLWRNAAAVHCRVIDGGPGMGEPDVAGTQRASPAAAGGRGLWIVRQLCDRLDVDTGPRGTTVTAIVLIDVIAL